MLIREGTINDLDAVTQLEALCFPAAEAAGREAMAQRLETYGRHFWLLMDGETLAAMVNGMVTDETDLRDEMYERAELHQENGTWQMIFGVATRPEYRGRGCAGRVLRQVIKDAAEQGRQGLVLTCKDVLLPFYARFGFVNEGASGSVHGNVPWNQMRLNLKG